jgi:hypothetical protein
MAYLTIYLNEEELKFLMSKQQGKGSLAGTFKALAFKELNKKWEK